MSRFKLSWITILIILADQATKLRVRHTMTLGESFDVFGSFFRISYVTNEGGAFGLSFGGGLVNRLLFLIAPFIALFLIFYLIKHTDKKLPLTAYFLILGGALGNLINRVAYGHVIDFLDVDFFFFMSNRFPVFNIADSAITIAVFLLIIDQFFSFRSEKRLQENDPEIVNTNNPNH